MTPSNEVVLGLFKFSVVARWYTEQGWYCLSRFHTLAEAQEYAAQLNDHNQAMVIDRMTEQAVLMLLNSGGDGDQTISNYCPF
jgi:hypothetical protein